MPIYEYTCTKCGKDFEELVFGDDLPACPHCGAAETRKLMSRCAHCSGGNGGDDSFAPSMPASSGGCAGSCTTLLLGFCCGANRSKSYAALF